MKKITKALVAIYIVISAVQCNANDQHVEAETGLTHDQLVQQRQKEGQEKLQKMIELEAEAEVPYIIDVKNLTFYGTYVYQKYPRPYDVVILLNLDPSEQEERCRHCATAEKYFFQAAYSFKNDQGGSTADRRIFFVRFHLNQSDHDSLYIFTEVHKYSTIPWLSVSVEDTHSHHKTQNPEEKFFESEWNIGPSDKMTAINQIDFINAALRTDVHLKLTLKQAIQANLLITGTLASLFVIVIVFYSVIMNRYVWSIIATVIWVLCQGGIVYNMMESPQPFGVLTDQNDNEVGITFFARSAHAQYKYEGFVYAATCCVLGLLFLLFFQVPKMTEDAIMQRVYLGFIALAILAIWMFLESVCAQKYQATPGFEPPSFYMKGSLMRNQGYTIL